MKNGAFEAECSKPSTSGINTRKGYEKNSKMEKFHNKSAVSTTVSHRQHQSKQGKEIINQALVSKKPITFDTYDILAKEPQKLQTFLLENLTDFNEFLLNSLPSNTIVQIVFILEKICLLTTNEENLNLILSQIQENWMKQLDMYLVKLSLEEEDKTQNQEFWKNPEAFWNSLLVIFETITEKFGNTLTQLFLKVTKSCLMTIEFLENSANELITEKLKESNDLLNRLSEKGELNQCTDNYKTITAIPNPNEVLIDKRPYLKENIIHGVYKNVEDYLDTHFRLLREDFLGPLRQAICAFRENLRTNTNEKISEIQVYNKAQFIKKNVYDSGCISTKKTLQKDYCKLLNPGIQTNKFRRNSDNFMIGNLLCFSEDNFKTIFFGLVKSTKGYLIQVELFEDKPFLYNQSYTMLASTNYFNPCYLVLKALQNYNTDNFPMEKYILRVVNEKESPGYLTNLTTFTINKSKFLVLDYETWPSGEKLNLNAMQYEAFKHALTSKFAIIQGPPGTGKTHLGLKIAQTLIENCSAWGGNYSSECRKGFRKTATVNVQGDPILVVAFTNHALDQFLAGLIPYTKNIIRMGGQSKNVAIRKFNFKRQFSSNSYLKGKLTGIYDDIQIVLTNNKKIMEELESVLLYKGIFDLKRLAMVNPELSKNWSYLNNKNIVSWLFGKFDNEQERKQRWNMINEISENAHQCESNLQFRSHITDKSYYILTVFDLQKDKKELLEELSKKHSINLDTIFQDWSIIEEDYQQIKDNILYLQWRLQHVEDHNKLYTARPENQEEEDLHQLPYNDRWILYFHWLNCYAQYLKNTLSDNSSKLKQLWEEVEKCNQKMNSEIISKATIVGMTTSGAAQNQHLLANLKCRVVIIEEAAEVLESHIITSLTSHCQHLILIGDHQQLRPSTNDYEIEKDYNLGVSLFERMVRNGVNYKTLQIQHRMRPEISRLIVPAIYPNLENHTSTYNFPNVNGITQNVFFITHTHPELNFGKTKKNIHEADYVIALARHLILQNIDPCHITILTTYKGQMYEIKEKQRMSPFEELKEIHVTVVDNFQGEENQIILLSLVRSNNYNSIGFLAIENRVCVALSRAKRGFYMIGNMNSLNRGSQLWSKINEVLENNGQIGPGLKLSCQLHPLNYTTVTNPEDFLLVPEGGCYESCNADLKCGHKCQKKCHVTDQDHKLYRCMEPCTRNICPENHPCPRKCSKSCQPCEVPIPKTLPCQHVKVLPCHMDVEDYECEIIVKLILKCGHLVLKPCHKDKVICSQNVETVLPKCGHKINKPCYADKDTFPCPTIVKKIIPKCSHNINIRCSQPIDQVLCKIPINIKHTCGHIIKIYCGIKNNPLIKCKEKCLEMLKCGHVCQNICHDPLKKHSCMEKCKKFKVNCKTYHKCNLLCREECEPCEETVIKNLPCGHSVLIQCKMYNRNFLCNSMCMKIKPCGHICYSRCHPICDYSCSFKVYKRFPGCNHGMTVHCSTQLVSKICWKCHKISINIRNEE